MKKFDRIARLVSDLAPKHKGNYGAAWQDAKQRLQMEAELAAGVRPRDPVALQAALENCADRLLTEARTNQENHVALCKGKFELSQSIARDLPTMSPGQVYSALGNSDPAMEQQLRDAAASVQRNPLRPHAEILSQLGALNLDDYSDPDEAESVIAAVGLKNLPPNGTPDPEKVYDGVVEYHQRKSGLSRQAAEEKVRARHPSLSAIANPLPVAAANSINPFIVRPHTTSNPPPTEPSFNAPPAQAPPPLRTFTDEEAGFLGLNEKANQAERNLAFRMCGNVLNASVTAARKNDILCALAGYRVGTKGLSINAARADVCRDFPNLSPAGGASIQLPI